MADDNQSEEDPTGTTAEDDAAVEATDLPASTETKAETPTEEDETDVSFAADEEDSEESADEDDDDAGIPMDKVQAVLNATVDKNELTPQMRRMMQRQAENTKRVEETIKGTRANPSWFVPLFCALMIIGLIWAVVYYLNSSYPIPNIGAWNLAIAFGIIMVGFIMTMWWR
ncbi:cell division protein CrgA [uncultured Bifidobacterium sp.]|uniref:cell division protein CrgA n=1 Tax=uncultured Bifidobacterium sp. TaxID=165187 RepID=UPI0028DD30E1|nr:cell division protein CrgA [uncultured Bifidobacterium sp.]